MCRRVSGARQEGSLDCQLNGHMNVTEACEPSRALRDQNVGRVGTAQALLRSWNVRNLD